MIASNEAILYRSTKWKQFELFTRTLYRRHVSISDKTSYCKISPNIESTWLGVNILMSLWNLAGGTAGVQLTRQPNFTAMEIFKFQSRAFNTLWDTTVKTPWAIKKDTRLSLHQCNTCTPSHLTPMTSDGAVSPSFDAIAQYVHRINITVTW